MQNYVGLGFRDFTGKNRRQRFMQTHREVIYVCLTTAYCVRIPYLYMCCIKYINRGLCSDGESTKTHAENSIDIIYKSV